MSESKTGTQQAKTKRFSNFRCVRCHRYLVPCTEEKMDLFQLTKEQKEKIRKHDLTFFCPFCVRGYQRTYGEPKESTRQPLPFATIVKGLETRVVDQKGRIHKIVAMGNSLLHVESVETEKKEKNPDLVCLGRLNRDKIYYNPITEEFWLLRIKPYWLKKKRVTEIESWNKLDEHDLDTMLALGLVWYRMDVGKNPLKNRIYLRKALMRKMRKILGLFKQWESS